MNDAEYLKLATKRECGERMTAKEKAAYEAEYARRLELHIEGIAKAAAARRAGRE